MAGHYWKQNAKKMELAKKEKNLVVEILKQLLAEQIRVYWRTNAVKSSVFSEIMQKTLNSYLNGMMLCLQKSIRGKKLRKVRLIFAAYCFVQLLWLPAVIKRHFLTCVEK